MKVLCIMTLWITTGEAYNLLAARLLACEWTVYKLAYSKNFNKQEESWRCKIYSENRNRIIQNNLKFRNNETTFKMNINHFTDRLKSEIIDTNGYMGLPNRTNIHTVNSSCAHEIDWRQLGAVTYVRDQGVCGSCYAITTAQVLEGQLIKYYKTISPLSSQRFIDCSSDVKNFGCNGGLMSKSYSHVMKHDGLEDENSYPYTGEEGVCKMNKTNYKIAIKEFVSIPVGNETALQHAVATHGPVAVGIDAGQQSLAYYSNGVYYDPKCSSKDVNHAVLVVGYGTDNGVPYWIIKNSWGPDWGEGGYFRLKRGCNHCGIAQMASYPITELPFSNTSTVDENVTLLKPAEVEDTSSESEYALSTEGTEDEITEKPGQPE